MVLRFLPCLLTGYLSGHGLLHGGLHEPLFLVTGDLSGHWLCGELYELLFLLTCGLSGHGLRSELQDLP